MTLPIWTTNPYTALATSQIEDEFGGDAPTSLGEYYRNGSAGYVTGDRVGFPNGVSTPIPLFGSPLAISNFYGASAVSYSITTNKTAYNEGETMSISVTAPAADGSTLYWTIEDVTTGIDISPTTLPNGIKGGYANEAYQPVQLTASGGTGPYTFSVVVGSLPAGLTLSSAGSISGFPTSAGVTTFTVQAIDSQGNGGIRQYSLSVANVTYLPATLPNGTQGIAYSQQLSVSGGTPPYVYEVMGSLPAGLTLSSSGLLSGTPTGSGTFNTSIRAIFNGGSMGDPGITIFYQDWIIGAPVNISVNPSNLATGTVNASYSQQLTASGGTSPYTYSTSSALPTGVTLSSSGLLSGTPTQSGSYNLAIQVNDNAGGSSSVQRTLSVSSVNISISPNSLPSASQNSAFSQQLSASGGTGPYTYSATGQLPAGLSLTGGGLLAGTPTGTGTFSIEVVANDANSNAGSKTYSLVIDEPTYYYNFYGSEVSIATQMIIMRYDDNPPGFKATLEARYQTYLPATTETVNYVISFPTGDISMQDFTAITYSFPWSASETSLPLSASGSVVLQPHPNSVTGTIQSSWVIMKFYMTNANINSRASTFSSVRVDYTPVRGSNLLSIEMEIKNY